MSDSRALDAIFARIIAKAKVKMVYLYEVPPDGRKSYTVRPYTPEAYETFRDEKQAKE